MFVLYILTEFGNVKQNWEGLFLFLAVSLGSGCSFLRSGANAYYKSERNIGKTTLHLMMYMNNVGQNMKV
ncbi:hypothetical protein HYPSUDRAFT_40915 [Hypholoma sublateritium FD-334 SS-4]|uniref:Uncharacterized protein n=1 Tax=Hypholoma sublateritium (strain FD-334 SS-4) TaxID=945553 RepID=A0A0D2NUI2_HYPSF|nr:hypothetical protein HYPSUDRAFT_40915 [Hypholoma sublateritium FD-334 SS-4]